MSIQAYESPVIWNCYNSPRKKNNKILCNIGMTSCLRINALLHKIHQNEHLIKIIKNTIISIFYFCIVQVMTLKCDSRLIFGLRRDVQFYQN